jgi:hypothetical protein
MFRRILTQSVGMLDCLTPSAKAVTFPVNKSRKAGSGRSGFGRSEFAVFVNHEIDAEKGIAARARKSDPAGSIWDGKSSIGS